MFLHRILSSHAPLLLALGLTCTLQVSLARGQTYRTYDGQHNNLAHPSWGAAGTEFRRLDSIAHYADLIASLGGADRPNPRLLSNDLGVQGSAPLDPRQLSSFVWQWGQFLDHDITLTRGGESGEIVPVTVPLATDPLWPMIPFERSGYAAGTGTGTDNPRQQMNDNTAYIDASMVYGSDEPRAMALRTLSGGRMKTSPGEMLPYNTDGLWPNANEGQQPDESLFLAGDVRANEQLGLIAMHTLFVREHNWWADQLADQHPSWNDEQLYQHARKLVGGTVQAITYNEFLPHLIGGAGPDLASLQYDATVDASISNEFATAAFRLGHTQVVPDLMRRMDNGSMATGGDVAMHAAFFNPGMMSSSDELDFLLKGLAMQQQQMTDTRLTDTLRNAMFGPPGAGGLDLFSLNVQRGRDHGLPSYNRMRELLGLTPAEEFSDITGDDDLANAMATLYTSVDDVDLWIGGLAEPPMSGAAVGELFQAVLADEFTGLATGDRFFFLWDEDLSAAEKDVLMQTRLSDVILRNTQIEHLQENVFQVVPEPGGLALVSLCAVVALWATRVRRLSSPG